MLHMTLILEDMILIATRDFPVRDGETGEIKIDPRWNVHVSDGFSGKHGTAVWTDLQISAVTCLAHGLGEEHDGSVHGMINKLYEIAEDAIKDLPPECRPIP